ncbi:Transposase, IS3 family [Bacillus thuringiensis serovar pakistani str. T13001]|uniref:transposase n=1 Tax=Bacillus cereus TaxID=1396 RepID=UPI0001A19B32|nr:transposase [Bacillus cereus]EEM44038.1 Transposase, IS3 family [Bacillus thuringiensis serovar pakistani str. T13001]
MVHNLITFLAILLIVYQIGYNYTQHISPVAWQQINFYGRYEFSKSPTVIDLETIIKNINEDEMLTKLTQERSLEEE